MPTWTVTQYLHQNDKLKATPSVKSCVSRILKKVTRWTTGASCSGRPVAREKFSSEKKVHLPPNTDGEKYISKFDDYAKKFKPQSEGEDSFYNQVLNSTCARFGEDPNNIQNFPLNVAIWSQVTRDCLWASSWLTKDHENFYRMAMKKSSPGTQDLTQSVQRQVKILIDRKGAYNMQILQDWNTFRWSRISLLSDPAAKWTRMKFHVFSDSTLCVGVSNPDPSNNWATKYKYVRNEHGFVENFNLAAREVQFIWHVLPGASAIDIKRNFQKYLNGQNPESLHERINTENCLHTSKEVAAFATQFKPGHWCFLARVRKYVVERKFQRTSRILRCCRIADGWHIQVSHFPPDISSDRAIIDRLGSWGKEEAITISNVHSTTSRFSSRPNLQAIYNVCTIEVAVVRNWKSGTCTENNGRWRTNRSRTRAVDITRKDTSSRRLVATTHRESRDDSESFWTDSICQNSGKWQILHYQWICYVWKQFYAFLQRILRLKKFSKSETTSSSYQSCQDRTSDGNCSIQICKNFGVWSTSTVTKSWVRVSRTIEQYARHFVPTETDHQNLEASAQQSIRCGRPWTQETGGNSSVRYQAAPKPKLISIGFSQRV